MQIRSNGPDEDHDDDLEVLTYEECLAHLATNEVGRLAVMVGFYPQVFPVNYRLDDAIVVFRTHLGTKLWAAHGKNVAFEVDEIDPTHHTGWSVSVQGMAEDITGHRRDTVSQRTEDLGVEAWAGGEDPRLVRIIPARVSGRRIVPQGLGWSTDARGYL